MDFIILILLVVLLVKDSVKELYYDWVYDLPKEYRVIQNPYYNEEEDKDDLFSGKYSLQGRPKLLKFHEWVSYSENNDITKLDEIRQKRLAKKSGNKEQHEKAQKKAVVIKTY